MRKIENGICWTNYFTDTQENAIAWYKKLTGRQFLKQTPYIMPYPKLEWLVPLYALAVKQLDHLVMEHMTTV